MPDTQILERRALIDAPELLAGVDGVRLCVISGKCLLAAGKPARRALTGCLSVLVFCWVFHTFVERHGNIRAEVRLDTHAFLRAHEDLMAVEVRGKCHALLLDFPKARQRENLKPAGVCQNRAIPRHKFVQAAHVAHNLVTRTQMQMIGIGKFDLGSDFF